MWKSKFIDEFRENSFWFIIFFAELFGTKKHVAGYSKLKNPSSHKPLLPFVMFPEFENLMMYYGFKYII